MLGLKTAGKVLNGTARAGFVAATGGTGLLLIGGEQVVKANGRSKENVKLNKKQLKEMQRHNREMEKRAR